ncbi:MAG: hypothetical protein KDI79_15345 [Anaerolineae bacterium]|nr:hypothetical protein [Anaerolineae bacterium]
MSELSTKQQRVIAALLTESTIEKAADSAGVNSRTIRRWMKDDSAFQKALAKAEAEAVHEAARGIAGGASEAAAYLRKVVANEGAETRERIMAARILLARLPDFRLAILEERMAAIEEAERAR